MAAIGLVANAILKETTPESNFQQNIVVTASSVNELIQLVIDGEVDAALIWRDMLTWKGADALSEVVVPSQYNKVKEIRVGVLSTSNAPKQATKFYDYMKSKGRLVFEKHGFIKD